MCYSCDASMCSECFSLHNCAEEDEEEEADEVVFFNREVLKFVKMSSDFNKEVLKFVKLGTWLFL
jgi:hypothetical protein